jgi:hypothetical protein
MHIERHVYSEICKVLVFSGSPPCPDYVTPLKKRRLARESLSSEQSFTPPTTPTMLADQQLSSSSPPTQKCVQYDVTGINLVSLEWCWCLHCFHCLKYTWSYIVWICICSLVIEYWNKIIVSEWGTETQLWRTCPNMYSMSRY